MLNLTSVHVNVQIFSAIQILEPVVISSARLGNKVPSGEDARILHVVISAEEVGAKDSEAYFPSGLGTDELSPWATDDAELREPLKRRKGRRATHEKTPGDHARAWSKGQRRD